MIQYTTHSKKQGINTSQASLDKDVFAIPVDNKWLLHAPLHEFNALLDNNDLKTIKNNQVEGFDQELMVINELVRRKGHITPTKKTGALKEEFIVFVTTRGCNLQCTYCHFDGPTSAKNSLSFDNAKNVIDWSIERIVNKTKGSKKKKKLPIHFFGGEPFTTFDLIKDIVNYTNEQCSDYGIEPFFMATTNGVLTESMRTWIIKHFHKIIISIDGTAETHDKHRPISEYLGSFEPASETADILSKSKVELHIRACITSETVTKMLSMVEYMVNRWHPSGIKVEPLTENILTKVASLYPPDPAIFAKNWYDAFCYLREVGIDFAYTPINPGEPRLSSCLVGNDAIVVHPDGSLNACYLTPEDWSKHGMNLQMGSISTDGEVIIEQTNVLNIREMVAHKNKCENCFCKYSCAGGCHVTNTYLGSTKHYNDFCIGTRLISACLMLDSIGCESLIERFLNKADCAEQTLSQSSDRLSVNHSIK